MICASRRTEKIGLGGLANVKRISRRKLLGQSLGLAGIAAAGLPVPAQIVVQQNGQAQSFQSQSEANAATMEAPPAAAKDLPSKAEVRQKLVLPVRQSTGKFIWCRGEAKPQNFHLFARRTFEIDRAPSSVQLRITASDRYAVFVNATYLGRGPARSDPRRKSYDIYDVTSHLKAGRNVVAVQAYYYGYTQGPPAVSGNSWTIGERAGLWAQLEIQVSAGETKILGTDHFWRVHPAQGWNRRVKGVACPIGCTVYDAGADRADWMTTSFDDSDWEEASVIPDVELEWVLLEARDIPMMQVHESFPQQLIEIGEVIDVGLPGQTDIKALLNAEIHFPLETAVARQPKAVLQRDGRSAEFQGTFTGAKGIRAPYIILDFGRQIFGFPRIRLSAEKGAMLDMTYGQEIYRGRMPFPIGYPMADRYITKEGEQTWELPEYKQFRYLHLTFRSMFSPIRIESISVDEYRYPAPQRGRFACSDPLLTKLWQACIDTTYLSMEDVIVCDACRERAVFTVGDGGHGIHGVYVGYGDLALVDHHLRLYSLSERGTGRLQTLYPPENPWNHSIPQFYSQWSARLREHLLFTGRRELLEELYISMRQQIDWYEPHRDGMGVLRDLPGWNWFDWAPVDVRGANFATNALYVKGLEDAAWLAEQMQQPGDAKRWSGIAAELRTALRLNFWNDQKGWYEDSHYKGRLTGVASEIGNGCALLYDIATEDQVERIGAHFSTTDQSLVAVSPLYFGYVADGLIKRGLAEKASALARLRFADMINASDHPTIWEGWTPFALSAPIDSDESYHHPERQLRPYGPLSLVHTGGVLTAYVLSTRILGLMPTAPGFGNCLIHPHVAGLEWAKGTFPSPRGDVQIEWRSEGGKLVLKTELPQTVGAEVVLDRDAKRSQVLAYKGARYSVESLEKAPQNSIAVDRKSIRVSVSGGVHIIQLFTGR